MGRCDSCGNEYDRSFQVEMNGKRHTFDCFECAIQSLAPTCHRCSTRIIGHGVEAGVQFFCCAHCAQEAGADGLRDRS